MCVLAGGVGGARFTRGLLAALAGADGARTARPVPTVTVIGNTGDDIEIWGLHVSPDLDTVMYTLGGGIDDERGWGRPDEGWRAKDELAAYGEAPDWFGLGDRDLATHVLRTRLLREGATLSAVTRRLCERWDPGVTLLPMTDDPVRTHVELAGPTTTGGADADGGRVVHFQEWWVRLGARVPARAITAVGAPDARPAPGVLAAIRDADLVLLPPSNPVVSVGVILAVPGIAEAVRTTAAPVVGLSPIVGGAPVRGMADACLRTIGVETRAGAVAAHYGARDRGGLLDGWLVDTADAAELAEVAAAGIEGRAVPLLMPDVAGATAMARAALALADDLADAPAPRAARDARPARSPA